MNGLLPIEDLYEDYISLAMCYDKVMSEAEFGYNIVRFSVKMLMDCASNHKEARILIQQATEEGIVWHVEEKKSPNHEDK